MDMRTRYKGLCGCLRETERGVLCFSRSEEIGPSSTLKCHFLLNLFQRVHRSQLALGNALVTVLLFSSIFNICDRLVSPQFMNDNKTVTFKFTLRSLFEVLDSHEPHMPQDVNIDRSIRIKN